MRDERATDSESPVNGGSFRASLAALRGAQKTPKGVSLYSLRINRPAGRMLAAGAHVLGLTPNQVSLLSGACSFLAIGLLIAVDPSPLLGILVGLALVLGFALDSADGQLARLRRSGSRAGEWFDHVLDCAVKLGLHAAVLVAWFRLDVEDQLLLVPLGFQFVSVMLYFGGTLAGKLHEQVDSAGVPLHPRPAGGGVHPLFLLPADHGVVSLSFLLWGWQDVFTPVYTVLFAVHAVYLAGYYYHWLRELS